MRYWPSSTRLSNNLTGYLTSRFRSGVSVVRRNLVTGEVPQHRVSQFMHSDFASPPSFMFTEKNRHNVDTKYKSVKIWDHSTFRTKDSFSHHEGHPRLTPLRYWRCTWGVRRRVPPYFFSINGYPPQSGPLIPLKREYYCYMYPSSYKLWTIRDPTENCEDKLTIFNTPVTSLVTFVPVSRHNRLEHPLN